MPVTGLVLNNNEAASLLDKDTADQLVDEAYHDLA